ncbi:hypothetical protein CSA37_04240 [Candidatus Fermentibacteria bacterium]|nr:MAG: hypothetical protein CSA37_04240 [Candidatus Fermentibacteria bacterium]
MIFLILTVLLADPWGDASPAVQYGDGAGYGQAYYPENILGPPDPAATPTAPSYGENNLLTLGTDGWVVIEFTDNTVINGDGPDFTVFENVMQTGSGYFRECAFVEVSQNGSDWYMFPWDATTLEGLAGVWPTTGEDPTDPAVSGGDQFDLEDLNLDWIRFVRLTDCGSSVPDGGLFDLDAVASIHWTTGIEDETGTAVSRVFASSPFNSSLTVSTDQRGELRCYSAEGRIVGSWPITDDVSVLNTEALPAGVLLFTINNSSFTAVKLAQ